MPSKPDLRKTRVKWSGGTVNPDLYARVGGQPIRLDPDDISPPGQALAMPAGAVNGWGTSADLYDSVAVNIHFDQGGPYAVEADVVADVARLGIRQVRDGGCGRFSWISYEHYNNRVGIIAIRNRNAALPAPSANDRGQPIFLQIDAPGWGHPTNLTGPFGYLPNTGYPSSHWSFSISRPYAIHEWFYGMDGGSNGWGHYDTNGSAPRNMPASHDNSIGFRIPDGVTSNPNATMPNPWAWSDPEMPWEIVGGIALQNEAGLGWPDSHSAHGQMKPWGQAMYAIAKNTAHQGKVVAGPPRVTTQGIQANIRAAQIPMAGVVVMSYGLLVDWYGDMSQGTNVCDVGDRHPYQPGVRPSHEWIDKFNYPSRDGANYNGALASPPSASKGLPWFATEVGQTTSTALADGAGGGAVTGAQNHNTWPTPPDVAAEYLVTTFLLHYWRGVRRTFAYELYDVTVGGWGMYDASRVIKPQGLATRNLLRLCGFSEPTQAARQNLPVTVSGFPTLPANQYVDPRTGFLWWSTAQRLTILQTQQTDNTWLVWVIPQRKLWDRGVGNYNTSTGQFQAFANVPGGRNSPSTIPLTLNLPVGVSSVEEASPTAGLVGLNTAPYYSWPNPDLGFAYTPKTVVGNSCAIDIAGRTKVFRIVKP